MLDKDYYILLSMIETVGKILRYSQPYQSAEELYQHDRDFDATMMNFIVLGENVGKLSEQIKTDNPQIKWQQIYGLRNIIAHHYFGINVDLVWQIIQNDLPGRNQTAEGAKKTRRARRYIVHKLHELLELKSPRGAEIFIEKKRPLPPPQCWQKR